MKEMKERNMKTHKALKEAEQLILHSIETSSDSLHITPYFL